MLHTSWRTVDKSQRRKGWRSCPATIASAVAPGLPFMLLIIIIDVWVSICLGTAAWLRPIQPHAIKQHLDIGIDRHPNTHTHTEADRERESERDRHSDRDVWFVWNVVRPNSQTVHGGILCQIALPNLTTPCYVPLHPCTSSSLSHPCPLLIWLHAFVVLSSL